MKKLIPLLIAGAAAGYAIYKMKKTKEQEIIDLDEELLLDEEDDDIEVEIFTLSDKMEEDCENVIDDAKCVVEDVVDTVVEVVEETVEKAEAAEEELINKVEEVVVDKTEATDTTNEANDNLDEFDEVFVNLKKKDILAMKNNAIERLDALEKEGDDLSQDRPIYHSIRFNNIEDAASFRKEVVNKGYVITQGDQVEDLIVLHILPLDLVKIMSHVYDLANCAAAHHGTYLDWKITRKN